MIVNLILNFVNCKIKSSGPAHCHPEADPASSQHYSSSWACHFPAHQIHHRPLLLLISICLIRSLLQESQLSLRRYYFLPIFQSLLSHWGQCSAWLGGESWGSKLLLLMLSYFGNLVAFCLILKFLKVFILPSMLIKEKISNWNRRNWIFVFSLDLEFVLCLLKLMNCWSFYWIQA